MQAKPGCYHCGLPVLSPGQFSLQRGEDQLEFCCPACRAVALTILDSGLGKYYDYRTENALRADQPDVGADYSLFDREEFQQDFVSGEGERRTAILSVQGITCAACSWLIEHRLSSLAGVDRVHVNIAQHRASVAYDPGTTKLSTIFSTIAQIGYGATPWSETGEQQLLEKEQRLALRRLGVAGIGMMQVGMYAIGLHAGALQGIEDHYRDFLRIVSLLVATAVVFYAAQPFFQGAWRNIRNRSLGMDVPVAIAIGLAYGASCWATFSGGTDVYFDSVAMFTFFLLGSRYLEMRARNRSNLHSRGLATIMPRYAWLLTADSGQAQQVPVRDLAIGDRFLVKPGETIAADGRVIDGRSSVDESAFSGEYLPLGKTAGDEVTAGSINADGVLTVEVCAVAGQTRLATINRLLEQAQQERPRSAEFADRIAGWFVAAVLLCATLAAWWWYQVEPERALWVALSVLVVSCPCALSLATPTALTSALGALKARGILLSRSGMLEQLPRADLFVFDKTGTLTSGKLALVDTITLGELSEADCLVLAASLEQYSNHPIAEAFAPIETLPTLSGVEVCSGKGVEGMVAGVKYRIGSPAYALPQGDALPVPADPGNPQVVLSCDKQVLAVFELHDPLRSGAAAAIQNLQQQGFATAILSGDASGAVPAVAAAVGIDDYHAGQSPEQKLACIQSWQAAGKQVVMVGDGINDVPVLAGADMSVAMVNANELAKANADCLLLGDDLEQLPLTVATARRTRRIILENLGWALSYNILGIPLAAGGLIPPWAAAIGMSCSSLIVVGNALRLAGTRRSRDHG